MKPLAPTKDRNFLLKPALGSLFFLGFLFLHPLRLLGFDQDPAGPGNGFHPFSLFNDPRYSSLEIIALLSVLGLALAGLLFAWFLIGQVNSADSGTEKMRSIAAAIKEGAQAYLAAQFQRLSLFIILLTVLLYFSYTGNEPAFAFGRAAAFLLGSLFSWTIGYVGMHFATKGNLKVAAAATRSYAESLQLGYRTGKITGMLLDSLGLIGATVIFLIYGERSYEALLGFGFGGTLLALFMRVGGGIYTKGADVGADLVGKIEKGIPEDDPRNAATIADLVGDNVGDCAGMAADVFESYEVTMVAAMILGLASFGHIGVLFPLLVRGTGVIGSIISTFVVRARKGDPSDMALRSIHRGYWVGSFISVLGIITLGYFYLRFNALYLSQNSVALAGFPDGQPSHLSWWLTLGQDGLDLRPMLTCLIGILLAVTLNKVTSYYTHTEHSPVKSLAKACETGHATNIIQGLAIGYESSVAAIAVIGAAIFLSVLCYSGAPPIFVAFGISMTGIGMLTLSGNTISMDAFGPIADNANGVGEMGYDRAAMEKQKRGSYQDARRILADLDAVGNTTKAETKGIAIGSAVIAAVSLFASFIAVIAVGSEDKIPQMSSATYLVEAGKLSPAYPSVFIGFLIGGAIPFLFSSMLIRAVGRAAADIVEECRLQFMDKLVWSGKKKPDYGRVVDICTRTAQMELVGPAALAVFTPIAVGLILGPYALGGFLAGAILCGQLLAVFMANAGGAWDNAKKLIEDGHHGGKGSEAHKAAVTGDTVGDPLKDTAGPALNPLLKVMNMVALLSLGFVMSHNLQAANLGPEAKIQGFLAILLCLGFIGWALMQSRREIKQQAAGSSAFLRKSS